MKAALIIPIFNRPQYLAECLDSLKKADWPSNILVIMINDASTDSETIRLFNEFSVPGVDIIKCTNDKNSGIKFNIKFGVEKAAAYGHDHFIILDSDAIVKPEFFKRLLAMYPGGQIVTGFNSKTKNKDGSDRHRIIKEESGILYKESVGGINFFFDNIAYQKYILPALISPGNWDHEACKNVRRHDGWIVCLSPSVVQHIGFDSSMNHNEEPDVACDFYNLHLPNVTLFGADTSKYPLLQKAAEISQRDIRFGDVKILTTPDVNFQSKEDYNRFMIKDLARHINTDFVLTIQWDGYILNYKGWTDEFYEYDFIGATWLYKDGMNTGNGGFSMRSKKLLNILATDDHITQTMPEDHQICRTYRRYLETAHGIKFAPEELANKFSIEAYGCSILAGANTYSGQFGFHGFNVDYTGSMLPHIPAAPPVLQSRYPRQRQNFYYNGKKS